MRLLERRLSALERKSNIRSRRVIVILATDDADKERQLETLWARGAIAENDGLICLTGRPLQ